LRPARRAFDDWINLLIKSARALRVFREVIDTDGKGNCEDYDSFFSNTTTGAAENPNANANPS
jgi:hypothetical protein